MSDPARTTVPLDDLARAVQRLSAVQQVLASVSTPLGLEAQAEIARAVAVIGRTTQLLDGLAHPPVPPPPVAPVLDPLDEWAVAVAEAVRRADRVALVEAVGQAPPGLPAAVADCVPAAQATDWEQAHVLLDYVLGRLGCLTGPAASAVREATAALAVMAARQCLEEGPRGVPAEARARGYLKLALAGGGSRARHEAALAQLQRRGDKPGLALEAALRATELDPTLARAHVELGLAVAATGGDPGENFLRAAELAAAAPSPRDALTEFVGTVPPPVLALLLERLDARPEAAAEVLDALLAAPDRDEPFGPETDDDVRRRTVEAFRRRAAAAPQTVEGRTRAVDDLYEAATRVYIVDDEQCEELLADVLALDPDHRDAHMALSDILRLRAGRDTPPDRTVLEQARTHAAKAERSTKPVTDPDWERRILASLYGAVAAAEPGQRMTALLTAALHLELSIAAGTDTVWTHLLAVSLLRRLDLWAAAAREVEETVQRGGATMTELRDEQVLLQINSGQYAAAAGVLRTTLSGPWDRAALAYAQVLQGSSRDDVASATATLEELVAAEKPESWYFAALAQAYRLAGRADDGRATMARFLQRPDVRAAETGERASALLRLGHLAEAAELFAGWRPDPNEAPGRAWNLALARLPVDPDGVRGALLGGLRAERQRVNIDMTEWELDAVGAAVDALPDGGTRERARALLAEARAVVQARQAEPPDLTGIAEELDDALGRWFPAPDDPLAFGFETGPPEPDTVALAQVVLALLRARTAVRTGDVAAAVAAYRGLRGTAADAAARSALERLAGTLPERVAVSLLGGDSADALHEVELVADVADPAVVRESLARVVLSAADGGPAAAGVLQPAVSALLARAAGVEGAAEALAAVVDAAGDGRPLLAALAAVDPATLVGAVRARVHARRRSRFGGETIVAGGRPPVLAVELGSALVPDDTSDQWTLFAKDVPDMRAGVRALLGVEVPGVRFRNASPDAPIASHAFRILVGGVEVRAGELPEHDGDGVPAPERLGPVTAALALVVVGDPGVVVDTGHLDVLADELLTGDRPPRPELVPRLLDLFDDPRRRARLAGLLRGLARDGVHLGEWAGALLDVAARTRVGTGTALDADDVAAAVRAMRPHLRSHLLVNTPGLRCYPLPAEWEGLLADGVWGAQAAVRLTEELTARWTPLGTGTADALAAVAVGDEPARRRLQRVLRARMLPLVAVTAAEPRAAMEKEFPAGSAPGAAAADPTRLAEAGAPA
jgi:hypothetical protein